MENLSRLITAMLAFAALAGSFAAAYLTSDHSTELMLAGWAGGMATTVVGYYFGSSSGSAKKTDIIAAKVPDPAPAEPAVPTPVTPAVG